MIDLLLDAKTMQAGKIIDMYSPAWSMLIKAGAAVAAYAEQLDISAQVQL